jgi:hypothetical protein
MSNHDRGGNTQSPLSEDYASSRRAARLLRPRRSYGRPLIVLGVVAFLVAISQSGIVPGDQFKLKTQNESPAPPKRPDRFIPEQPVEPFTSLVLDAAQSYLVTRSPPIATVGYATKPSPADR